MSVESFAGDPRRPRREVVRLIRRIQELALELRAMEQRGASESDVHPKRVALEHARWRLAAVVRRAAR